MKSISLIVLFFAGLILAGGCLTLDCNNDGTCQVNETHAGCPNDCPDCDDGDNCTLDWFDYGAQRCVNNLTEGEIIFYDDFDNDSKWNLPDDYRVYREWGKSVLSNERGMDIARPLPEFNLGRMNYIIRFRAKIKDLAGIMSARYDLTKNYSQKYAILFAVMPKNITGLSRELEELDNHEGKSVLALGKGGGTGLLDVKEAPIGLGGWHDYKVILKRDIIQVYVDEKLYISYTDMSPLLQKGGIVFEGLGPRSSFSIDYIEVREIC